MKKNLFLLLLFCISFVSNSTASKGFLFNAQVDSARVDTTSKSAADSSGAVAEKILFVAEVMPQYPGGEMEMFKFLHDNLVYPRSDIKSGTEGRVIVRFVILPSGEISDIQVLRGLSPSFDKEAVRVLKLMPKWIPGSQNGKLVPVYYTIPFVFRMNK